MLAWRRETDGAACSDEVLLMVWGLLGQMSKLSVSKTCRRWRSVAIVNRSLWTSLEFFSTTHGIGCRCRCCWSCKGTVTRCTHGRTNVHLAELLLKRGGDLPVSVKVRFERGYCRFDLFGGTTDSILEMTAMEYLGGILARHAYRLRKLKIVTVDGQLPGVLLDSCGAFPILSRLRIRYIGSEGSRTACSNTYRQDEWPYAADVRALVFNQSLTANLLHTFEVSDYWTYHTWSFLNLRRVTVPIRTCRDLFVLLDTHRDLEYAHLSFKYYYYAGRWQPEDIGSERSDGHILERQFRLPRVLFLSCFGMIGEQARKVVSPAVDSTIVVHGDSLPQDLAFRTWEMFMTCDKVAVSVAVYKGYDVLIRVSGVSMSRGVVVNGACAAQAYGPRGALWRFVRHEQVGMLHVHFGWHPQAMSLEPLQEFEKCNSASLELDGCDKRKAEFLSSWRGSRVATRAGSR